MGAIGGGLLVADVDGPFGWIGLRAGGVRHKVVVEEDLWDILGVGRMELVQVEVVTPVVVGGVWTKGAALVGFTVARGWTTRLPLGPPGRAWVAVLRRAKRMALVR